MPSQVTLFFINIKIDCNIDLRTRNICRKSSVTSHLSANPSPSGSWTGWRIHEGDFERCSKNMRCVSTSYLVFVSPWPKCVPQYSSRLICRLKLSWFSFNLTCIWTGVPLVRWQQYKGCKRAGLTHTRVSAYVCLYEHLEQNSLSWKVIVRDVWPACKEPDLPYPRIHSASYIAFWKSMVKKY